MMKHNRAMNRTQSNSTLGLALYQPEIPQNTGTLIRLCAGFFIELHIIEPCGFIWSNNQLRRAGLDYHDLAMVIRYPDFETFQEFAITHRRRIILLDTKATLPYCNFVYAPTDIIMVGRESTGVPRSVYDMCDAQVLIPMANPRVRSLNMAVCAAIVTTHALLVGSGGG